MSGLSVLVAVFLIAALLGAPMGLSMLAAGFAYLLSTHQDVGLVVDQTMNGLYNSYLLIAVPLFIFVANVMNASGVIERLLAFGSAVVGRFPGGLAQVNVVSNLIFSGMSGSAVADAAGPGLIVARMMVKGGRYPAGFAAATSVASATIGPLVRQARRKAVAGAPSARPASRPCFASRCSGSPRRPLPPLPPRAG